MARLRNGSRTRSFTELGRLWSEAVRLAMRQQGVARRESGNGPHAALRLDRVGTCAVDEQCHAWGLGPERHLTYPKQPLRRVPLQPWIGTIRRRKLGLHRS